MTLEAKRQFFNPRLSWVTLIFAILQFIAGVIQMIHMSQLATKIGIYAFSVPEMRDRYGAAVVGHCAGAFSHMIASACILSRQSIARTLAIFVGGATIVIQLKFLLKGGSFWWVHAALMALALLYTAWFYQRRQEFED